MSANLNLLISLLLSKEQIVLFKHNRHRALIEKVSDSSSDSDAKDEKMPNLEIKAEKLSKEKKEKLTTTFLGYGVKSDIDRKLPMGIFDQVRRGPQKYLIVPADTSRLTAPSQSGSFLKTPGRLSGNMD